MQSCTTAEFSLEGPGQPGACPHSPHSCCSAQRDHRHSLPRVCTLLACFPRATGLSKAPLCAAAPGGLGEQQLHRTRCRSSPASHPDSPSRTALHRRSTATPRPAQGWRPPMTACQLCCLVFTQVTLQQHRTWSSFMVIPYIHLPATLLCSFLSFHACPGFLCSQSRDCSLCQNAGANLPCSGTRSGSCRRLPAAAVCSTARLHRAGAPSTGEGC